jgi:large subunit ribosomal protein L9
MDVILLERIEQLGQMGDVVSVKPGFARNFLFPKKKALRASKGNLEKFEGQRKELEAENLTRKGEAVDIAARMEGLQVVVIRSAGEAG